MKYSIDFRTFDGEIIFNHACDNMSELKELARVYEVAVYDMEKRDYLSDYTQLTGLSQAVIDVIKKVKSGS